jgi:hypothetical protein
MNSGGVAIKDKRMTLDIGIRYSNNRRERRLQLDNDGYYWFLHSWFERVRKATGLYVDLYGDAEFHRAKGMDVLRVALGDAMTSAQQLRAKSDIRVQIGGQSKAAGQAVYGAVERQQLIQLIASLQALIDEAMANNVSIYCEGD